MIDLQTTGSAGGSRSVPERHCRAALRPSGSAGIPEAAAYGGGSFILSVCLNPALQRTLRFVNLMPGEVNRTADVSCSAGGKGVLVARIIQQLGGEAALLGIFGGNTGLELLEILAAEHLKVYAVESKEPTRICQTLIDDRRRTETELVEEGLPAAPGTVAQVMSKFREILPLHRLLTVSGTIPGGFSNSTYAAFLDAAEAASIPVVLDACGIPLVSALKYHPCLVKPNLVELEQTMGESLQSSGSLRNAMESLIHQGASSVLVTRKMDPVRFIYQNEFYEITFPRLYAVNTIGSGDAIAAGFSLRFAESREYLEAVRYGIACGCANVLTPEAGRVNPDEADAILPKIEIRRNR